ncbi:hypothetical protein F4861DRAFT_537806 [Xylaria intraflava]|nr:hypothetical protein F4861DRAFT_537806 [Xylaria intraflava]
MTKPNTPKTTPPKIVRWADDPKQQMIEEVQAKRGKKASTTQPQKPAKRASSEPPARSSKSPDHGKKRAATDALDTSPQDKPQPKEFDDDDVGKALGRASRNAESIVHGTDQVAEDQGVQASKFRHKGRQLEAIKYVYHGNPKAANALNQLKNKDIELNEPSIRQIQIVQPSAEAQQSEIWKITNQNLQALAAQQIKLYNSVTGDIQQFVGRMLKDSVIEGPIKGQIHAVIEPAVVQAVSKINDKLDNLVRESGLQETLDAHGKQLATGADRIVSQNAVNKALYNFMKEIQKTVKWDVEKLSEIIPIVRMIERYFHKLRDRLREDDADILGKQQDRAKSKQATTHERRTQPATTAAATFGQPSQPTSMFGPFRQPNLGLGQPGVSGFGKTGMNQPGSLFLQTQSTSRAAASGEKIPWKVNTMGARGPQKNGSCEGPVDPNRKQWKGAVTIEQGTVAQGGEQAATRKETDEQDQAAEGDGTGAEMEKPKDSTPKKMEMNLW